jgi:hypothetical protein
MKSYLFLITLLTIASAQQFTDLVVDADNSKVFGTLYPNENGSFVLVIKNVGEANANNIRVKLESDSDITLYPSTLNLGQLDRQDQISVPIGVFAGNIDPKKTHSVLVSISYGGYTYDPLEDFSRFSDLWETWTLPLNISSRLPVVRPTFASPKDVLPGESFTLNVTLENIGEGDAKDVEVKVQPPQAIGSDKETLYRSFRIVRGGKSEASFELFLSEEADEDLYKIPISISYKDLSEKNQYAADTEASINVIAPAELSISNVRITPSPLKKDHASTLSIRVENTGNGEAENIVAVLETPSGTQRSFIGNLVKNEDSSVAFLLVPEAEGDFAAKIKITYSDDLGAHEINESMNLKAYNGDLVQYAPLVAAVLLAIALLFLILRGKK